MRTKRTPAAARLADDAALFAALGDESRLRIVNRLCADGPSSIIRLSADASITRQGVTKHLQALEQAGLVRSHRSGRERIWELETSRLRDARLRLERISRQWDQRIERLRALVERDG